VTRGPEKTAEFRGLPLFKRLYGFGTEATLEAAMVTAYLWNVDRAALAAALPAHPLVRLHPLSPLILIQSIFRNCIDGGDPDQNRSTYLEVMLAVALEADRGLVGPLFPLILFVDDPIAMAAGREFHGFPKVPAEIELDEHHSRVRYRSAPRGIPRTTDVLASRWECRRGRGAAAVDGIRRAAAAAARVAGVDLGAADPIELLSRTRAGEVWNLRQVPDVADPRRAVLSQLTRFRPRIQDAEGFQLLGGFRAEFPEEPVWSIGARFFLKGGPRPFLAFRWNATMKVRGGEVIDTW
jgi:hypothetical protein